MNLQEVNTPSKPPNLYQPTAIISYSPDQCGVYVDFEYDPYKIGYDGLRTRESRTMPSSFLGTTQKGS